MFLFKLIKINVINNKIDHIIQFPFLIYSSPLINIIELFIIKIQDFYLKII